MNIYEQKKYKMKIKLKEKKVINEKHIRKLQKKAKSKIQFYS